MMQIWPVFLAVFLAELGDKTQLATLLFCTEGERSPWMVFFASSLALILSTAIAVLLGTFAAEYLQKLPLKLIAGVGFIVLGGLTVAEYFRA